VTITQAVIDRLLAIPAVVALVGDRVYAVIVRQNSTMPAVRAQTISEIREYHLRGEVSTVRTRIQIDAFASETTTDPYGEACDLADAINGIWDGPVVTPVALSGWAGSLGGSPALFRIHVAKQINRREVFEGDVVRVLRIQQDYDVQWSRVSA
jgi:hypothetical protein